MRILYHAVNGTGLGHLMRTTAVAAHVRRLSGDAEVAARAILGRLCLFAILERCRAAYPRFRYDITARDSPA
jgi:hypothetical protein